MANKIILKSGNIAIDNLRKYAINRIIYFFPEKDKEEVSADIEKYMRKFPMEKIFNVETQEEKEFRNKARKYIAEKIPNYEEKDALEEIICAIYKTFRLKDSLTLASVKEFAKDKMIEKLHYKNISDVELDIRNKITNSEPMLTLILAGMNEQIQEKMEQYVYKLETKKDVIDSFNYHEST